MLDCKQKDSSKHIFQKGDSSRLDNFSRLIQLTKLHLDCLERIKRKELSLESFSKKDEVDLINKMEEALKIVRNQLVSLDMKDLIILR